MVTKETILVLGAGASVPYGYPTGKKLADQIIQGENDSEMIKELLIMGIDDKKLKAFFRDFAMSSSPSIDAFLEYRQEHLEIGKLIVTRLLIQCEHEKKLFGTNDWYQYLWQHLGTSFDEFGNNKLGIITFNYDRSLEHFLFNALKGKYGKTDEETAEKLKQIPIVHVHGQIGYLPWQSPNNSRGYRRTHTSDELKESSNEIKVVHEATGNAQEKFNEAITLLNSATNIYFLGFGYHKLNLERLKIAQLNTNNKNILGTSFHLTNREAVDIQDRVSLGKIKLLYPSSAAIFQPILEYLRENISWD